MGTRADSSRGIDCVGTVETLTSQKRTVHRQENEAELDVRVENALPSRLAVGRGNALVVWGSCFHRRQRIRELRVGVRGSEAAAVAHGMPRPDVFAALHPTLSLPLAAPIERDDDSEEDPLPDELSERVLGDRALRADR